MGRKSALDFGTGTLGTGVINAVFHCVGTTALDREALKSIAKGSAMMGAAFVSSQWGMPSLPGEVGLSASKAKRTLKGVIKKRKFAAGKQDNFIEGGM